MYKSTVSTISALLLGLLVTGCDASPADDEHVFRTGSYDVDVQLTLADGGEEDGTILWEILDIESANGETTWEVREYEPGTHPVDGGEEDGTILWEILEATTTDPATGAPITTWEINDPTGSLVCEIEDDGELRDATGTLLLEESGGSVYTAGGGTLLYSFDRVGVNDATGSKVLGTNPAQSGASAGRKLAIAALLEDECL